VNTSQTSALAALACVLLAAACSTPSEPQSGTDTRGKQERPVEPDGMKGGGGSGGGGM
jgi:hypothetical protein